MSESLLGRFSAVMSTSMLPVKQGAWHQVMVNSWQSGIDRLLHRTELRAEEAIVHTTMQQWSLQLTG